jgi:carboxypeptidase A4
MKISRLILGTAAVLGAAVASPVVNKQPVVNKVSYDGYKVYRVTLPDSDVIAKADDIASSFPFAAIELQRRRRSGSEWVIDIAVAPADVPRFEASEWQGRGTALSHDLGADLEVELTTAETEGKEREKGKAPGALPSLSWFNAYNAYADHIKYWADLHAAFPDNSELIQVGKSFEGRPLQGIHLWGKSGKDSKPAILFHGNVHAREWITSKVSWKSSFFLFLSWSSLEGERNRDVCTCRDGCIRNARR